MASVIQGNKDSGCCIKLLLLLASSVNPPFEIIIVTKTHLTDLLIN